MIMHEWLQKRVKMINMTCPSVQPCGVEITVSVVGLLGYKTCFRYGSRLRMSMDDNVLCYVMWKELDCMIGSVNSTKCPLKK